MFKETYRRLNDIIQPDKALVAAVLAGGQRRKRGAKQPFVRIKPALIAAAICLCLVLTVPVLAASVEPVYELIYLVSPSAAQFFVPVQKSDTNNGIKMEVVSADIRGDTARIYITMQDLIGDRVDETIDLYDSYDIRLPFDGTGFCGKVGYDPDTRTETFLITIKTDGQKIAGKKITFSVGMFLSDKHVYDDIQIPVDLCTVSQNPKTQTVEVFGGGGEDFEKVIDLHGRGQAQAMVPGDEEASFPVKGIDLTGVGYVDGKLHVQMQMKNSLDNSNHGYFYLKDADGNRVLSRYSFSFRQMKEQKGQISYCEDVFDVPYEELSAYKLYGYFVTSQKKTEGGWRVTFSPESQQSKD